MFERANHRAGYAAAGDPSADPVRWEQVCQETLRRVDTAKRVLSDSWIESVTRSANACDTAAKARKRLAEAEKSDHGLLVQLRDDDGEFAGNDEVIPKREVVAGYALSVQTAERLSNTDPQISAERLLVAELRHVAETATKLADEIAKIRKFKGAKTAAHRSAPAD